MGNKNRKQKLHVRRIKESFKLQLIVLVVLCTITFISYMVVDNMISSRLHRTYTITNDMRLVNDIENITAESDKILIEGYAFMSDRNSSDNLISVFLKNVITEDEIWLNMEQVDRQDVNAYFAGEYEYKNSGFIASIDSKKLDNNDIYEIFINIDYVQKEEETSLDIRRTISTNRYMSNAELYFYNPIEVDKPDMDIESELIKEVFKN